MASRTKVPSGRRLPAIWDSTGDVTTEDLRDGGSARHAAALSRRFRPAAVGLDERRGRRSWGISGLNQGDRYKSRGRNHDDHFRERNRTWDIPHGIESFLLGAYPVGGRRQTDLERSLRVTRDENRLLIPRH